MGQEGAGSGFVNGCEGFTSMSAQRQGLTWQMSTNRRYSRGGGVRRQHLSHVLRLIYAGSEVLRVPVCSSGTGNARQSTSPVRNRTEQELDGAARATTAATEDDR